MKTHQTVLSCPVFGESIQRISFAEMPTTGMLAALGLTIVLVTHAGPATAVDCGLFSAECGSVISVGPQFDSGPVIKTFTVATSPFVGAKPNEPVRFDQSSVPGLADLFPGWVFGAAAQASAGTVRATARITPGDDSTDRTVVKAAARNLSELNIVGGVLGETVRFTVELSLDGELDVFQASGPFAGNANVRYTGDVLNARFVSGTQFEFGPSGVITTPGGAGFSKTVPGTYISIFDVTSDWEVGTPMPVLRQRLGTEANSNGMANFFATARLTGITLPAGMSVSSEGLTFNESAPGQFDVVYAPVPIPGALWLFASGVAGLACFQRTRSLPS